MARVLLILAGAVPFLVPLLEHWPMTEAIGTMIRRLYGFQCHQRAARSYGLWHASFPVCSRCLGIYLGLGLAALVGRPRLRPDPYKAWILVGVVFVAVDVATEWVRLRPASAGLRFTTGAFLAYGIGLAILQALQPHRSR